MKIKTLILLSLLSISVAAQAEINEMAPLDAESSNAKAKLIESKLVSEDYQELKEGDEGYDPYGILSQMEKDGTLFPTL